MDLVLERSQILYSLSRFLLYLLVRNFPTKFEYRTFGVPETIVNHALVGNLFMLGAGGIFVVALSAYFGRLPVLFWFSIVAFLTAAWSAAATSLESFETARILHGFFSTVAQAVSSETYD